MKNKIPKPLKIITSLLVIFLCSCAEEKIRCIEGDCENGTGVQKEILENGGYVFRKGEFKDGKMVRGRYEYSDGTWLEGIFENNLLQGTGKVFYHDSSLYEGNLVQGVLHGHGIWKYKDGSIYEGDFTNDYRTGKGKFRYVNGDIYEGDFQAGLRHGQGTFTWAKDKMSHTGGWKKDSREGKGIVTFANGDIMEGVWAADTLVSQTGYNTKNTTTNKSFDAGSRVLKFLNYKSITHATDLFDESEIKREEPGTIEINDVKKSIIIRTTRETTQYPVLDKVVEAFEETFYYSEKMESDGTTILKFILIHNPENNFFSVRQHFSRYDYKTNGPEFWSTVLNTKRYELVK